MPTVNNSVELHGGNILGVREMRFALERERARSERTDAPFAMVVLTWADSLLARASEEELTAQLQKRLRLTDEAGWLGERQIAVLLTATGEGGAWKVAADLCKQLCVERQPRCEVFVYPAVPSTLSVEVHRKDGHDGEDGGQNSTSTESNDADWQQTRRLNTKAADAATFFLRPLPRWKRAVDVAMGSLVLTLATPILLLAAAAIKLTSKGPVFFTQQRTGLGGAPFKIYKLRTMVTDAEAQKASLRSISEQDGPAFKLRNDPRVTPIGRFLRKSCIDELPQLINVLRGEMSIVGPRPLPVDEADKCQNWARRRLDITPGLTCIWQVRGALKVTFAEWMRMDIRYLRRRTLWADIKLIGQTTVAVLAHRASC